MTLVRNRRLRLNGNKFQFILFFCLVFLFSCDPSRRAKTNGDVIILQPNKTDSTQVVHHQEDTIKIVPPDNHEQKTEGKSWAKKSTYNIAYILPFESDALELSVLMSEEKISGYQPLASIEFYEGAKMALDSLNQLGIGLNVYVYNNVKDSASTAELFLKPEMKTMDLIIGPIFNSSLRVAAEFAKENEIFLISPLSPSQNITTDNRYYLMANSTLKMQMTKMLDFFYSKDKNANVILIYRDGKYPESIIGKEMASSFNENTDYALKKQLTVASTIGQATAAIKQGVQNFIFIASTDELYVNGLIRDLSKSSRGNDDINIVGMPGMLNLESISIDYFEGLNFHYATSYWIDENAPRTEKFISSFESSYECLPSDYAFRGYDITYYFGQLLKMYGPDIASHLDKYSSIRSPLYRFHFVPAFDEENKLKYFENENIVILKYDNYRFEKVN